MSNREEIAAVIWRAMQDAHTAESIWIEQAFEYTDRCLQSVSAPDAAIWSLTILYSNLRGAVNKKCRANNWTLAEAREAAPVAPRAFTALMQGREELTLPEFRYLCEWLEISANTLFGLN